MDYERNKLNNINPCQEYRPWLLFLIEEGFKGDLISRYRDDFATMDAYLENIYVALAELESRYKVAVIIYPVQFYSRNAFGRKDAALPDRIHPALHHALRFFERKYERGQGKISFFLEMYSSGIATEQNGELSELQPPPLYKDGSDQRIGLSMDLDTAAALKGAYPNTFAGLRFHEIYGSDLVMKLTGGHAFLLDGEIVGKTIDLCRKEDLILYWTDSCWLMNIPESGGKRYVNDENYHPYFATEPYKSLQDHAVNSLGKKVIFSYANNNYNLTNNLERLTAKVKKSQKKYSFPVEGENPVFFSSVNGSHVIDESLFFDVPYEEHPLKHLQGAGWGISNQSWFWSEMVFTIGGKKYYPYNDDDCPVELISAFTRKALREKADGIQFEPAWYLFNSGNPHQNNSYGYEDRPDYTPRTNFLRLKEVLLSHGRDSTAPHDPNDYFDTDMQKLVENDAANPPVVYSQNTLLIYGERFHGAACCFDFYSNGMRWVTGQPYRMPGVWHKEGIVQVQRIALNGSGDDAVLQVRREGDGALALYFYKQNGVLMGADREVLKDESREAFVTMTTANLQPCADNGDDADEIIVVKKNRASGKLCLHAYSVEYHPQGLTGFKCIPVSASRLTGFKELRSAVEGLEASEFGGILGLRDNTVLYRDKTRPADRVAVFQWYEGGIRLKVLGGPAGYGEYEVAVGGSGNPWTDQCGWRPINAAALDINGDRCDEILIPESGSRDIRWNCYAFSGSKLELVETCSDPYSDYLGGIASAAGMRKVVMTNGTDDFQTLV